MTRGSRHNQKLTMYRHGRFDFLKLPLELREAIYKILFEDNKHCPPKKQPVIASLIRHAGGRRIDPNKERRLPTEILRTCDQIYHEAQSVLYRMRPVTITVCSWAKDKFHLAGIDVAPLAHAQKLLVEIGGKVDAGPVQYGQKRFGSIGKMLSNYAAVFIAAHVATGPYREIRLKFMLTGHEGHKPKVGDEQHSNWDSEIWHWTQAGEAVKAMREDLKKKAPAMNNLKITSNVEGKIPKVKTSRYDASRVWYRNSETKNEGFLGLDANGKVVPIAAPPPKPKPKSKIKPKPKSRSKSKSKAKPKSKSKTKTTK